jgi:predicted RNA-binding protein with PIN domain
MVQQKVRAAKGRAVTFLIDGYNLMHHIGLLHGPGGAVRLDSARRRLLDLVSRQHGAARAAVTVVFDAGNGPKETDSDEFLNGLRVVFSKHDTADDWIIQRVRTAVTPSQVTVVSNDHRVLLAASRRGCVAMGCEQYLDRRARPARPRATERRSDKPEGLDADETQRWLREFGFEE